MTTRQSSYSTNNNSDNTIQTIPSTPKAQTAKEVIAANVKLLIEQLEAGHSEGLTAYLTAMGRFHNYSFGNILEIARQKPDATQKSSTAPITFHLATTSRWTDNAGDRQSRTEWHTIVDFNNLGKYAARLKKGDRVYVEG